MARESERLRRAARRDEAEEASRKAQPPSEVRESTAGLATSADDDSQPLPPQDEQPASMGPRRGDVETRSSSSGKRRGIGDDLEDEDQRESISVCVQPLDLHFVEGLECVCILLSVSDNGLDLSSDEVETRLEALLGWQVVSIFFSLSFC